MSEMCPSDIGIDGALCGSRGPCAVAAAADSARVSDDGSLRGGAGQGCGEGGASVSEGREGGSGSRQPVAFQIHLVTIFPQLFESFLRTSLVGKAVQSGLLGVSFVDPRSFSGDRHRTVDDTPFGGGRGMVMKPEPVVAALEAISPVPVAGHLEPVAAHRVLLTPQGAPLAQRHLDELQQRGHLALVCGRYEGFDERIRDFVEQEISLGDFVLGGGEVAAMALIEGVARLIPGVIGSQESLCAESHAAGLLEYPHYTRPRVFRGREVPEVLLSGDHERIRRWREDQMLRRTRERRPDLWAAREQREGAGQERTEIPGQSSVQSPVEGPVEAVRTRMVTGRGAGSQQDEAALAELAARTFVALLHWPVYDRAGKVVTTAITNLDVHDIARSSRTYGLAGYFVVTPLRSQRLLAERIAEHWRSGYGSRYNQRRAEALRLLEVAGDLDEVLERIEGRTGRRPLAAVTSAISRPGQVSVEQVVQRLGEGEPLLLILGTGWGLTEDALAAADLALQPIRGPVPYNHLSVRSAAAILLDRFFGLRHESALQGAGHEQRDTDHHQAGGEGSRSGAAELPRR